jgi:hypothetical protein
MSIHLTPHGLSRPHWYALVAVLAFSFLLIPQKSEAGIYARIPPPADIHETPVAERSAAGIFSRRE